MRVTVTLSKRVGGFLVICSFLVAFQFSTMQDVNELTVEQSESEVVTLVQNETTTRDVQASDAEAVVVSSNGAAPRRRQRISFQLRHDLVYNNTFNPYIQCPLGQKIGYTGKGNRKEWYDRFGLPMELQTAQGVLDFVTTISTDLKLLYMGDSVAIELAQGMEEAAGATFAHRTVLREAWVGHESSAISAPVRGGGVVASWRVTAMLSRTAEGRPLPNAVGGGWLREDAIRLLNYTYTLSSDNESGASAPITTVGSMDALIFRVMHGWIPFEEITVQALKETVELAHELLGVKTIIFITVPFSNNVKTEQDLRDMHRTNNIIRAFGKEWRSVEENGVQYVLVQEYGNFTHELIERHARAIGMNTSIDNDSYMLLRLNPRYAIKFPVSVAHACATLPRGRRNYNCDRNVLTSDGMHPCMETVGARLSAGVACLLACVYNHNDTLLDTNPDASFVRQCEEDCNNRFMTLKPVDHTLNE